jgi:hypothetical protein
MCSNGAHHALRADCARPSQLEDCTLDLRHSLQSSETNYRKERRSWFLQLFTFTFKKEHANHSKQDTNQHIERRLDMERVPLEVWQQILLKVMEMDDAHTFATSCTPYTFLYFVKLQTRIHKHRKSHLDYLERRRRLRLVCRAWNDIILLTRHRWLQLGEGSAVYDLDSTTPGARGVRGVEKLSMAISSEELVTPVLSWASHILKRPDNQSPLRAYTLRLLNPHTREYNLFEYLVGMGTTPEYVNTTLRSLSITKGFDLNVSITLPQISSIFTGLRSLFLINIVETPWQTMALPHLEVLLVHHTPTQTPRPPWPIQTWDTPALRHVHLGHFRSVWQFTGVLDRLLGRYAHQIESLVLLERRKGSNLIIKLPPNFWAQFSALRLFGVNVATLQSKHWSGWTVVPPTTHPLRYLVCWSASSADSTINRVREEWTWHGGVRLVTGPNATDTYHVIKDVRDDQWITRVEEIDGVLPEL